MASHSMKVPSPSPPIPNSSQSRSRVLKTVLLSVFLSAWAFNFYNDTSYIVCSDSNNIYTVDENTPRVACISVKNSKIHAIGSYDQVTQRSGIAIIPDFLSKILRRTPKVYKVEPDSVVVPGLADAHAHIMDYGFMTQLPLAGTQSIEEILELIKAFIHQHPDVENDRAKWIEGMGWDQTRWSSAQFPSASDLERDPILKGRPISLSRVDGHAKWVSPRVLELMGELPDHVEGGLIVRDSEGRPTGVFVDNAMDLIPTPEETEETMGKFFDKTMQDALAYGLTSIHDAMTTPKQIQFFMRKAETGTLPNRLYLMGHVPSSHYWGSQIPQLVNYGKQEHLTVKSVKLVADGALGSWGAALLQPYSDKPSESGLLLTPPDELRALVNQFWEDGFQVNIHCIGDRANHIVLDIFEDILTRQNGNVSEWRPRIEHAQIMTLADIQRIGRLGVIASVQPTHATSDMGYAETRLGPERIKGAYAYKSLLQASPNHVLPLGSDFPVESINPLLGFYAAVTRLRFDPSDLEAPGDSPHGRGGWFPQEKLTRSQALKGMTLDAAYASHAEKDIGSLTPGKKADFVIFDKDIMTVPPSYILKTKVLATVIDGQVVYGTL